MTNMPNAQSEAERKVKAVWPDAFALQFAGAWQIASASYGFPVMPFPGERIPRYLSDMNCDTESAAWLDAASRLPQRKEPHE